MKDTMIQDIIRNEELRQRHNIELIASENYVTEQVLEALGSICTNKYAEGYPLQVQHGIPLRTKQARLPCP